MDWFFGLFEQAGTALFYALTGLLGPAAFFLCLGYIVKRKALFRDIRRAIPEAGLNLQLFVFDLFFVMPIIALAGTFLVYIWHTVGLAIFTPEDWQGWPVWLVILLGITIGDFTGYWRHRFEHNSIFWPSHAVHHSDTEMTWLSLARFHPINRLTTFTIDTSMLLFLGMPPYVIVANSLVRHYYGYFIHADLPWTYGKLGVLFVSPAMHRWHHSSDSMAHGRNFATVYGIWDWTFGTYYLPGVCDSPLGVTDDMKPTLWSQLTYAFRPKAYAHLFRRKPKEAVTPAE